MVRLLVGIACLAVSACSRAEPTPVRVSPAEAVANVLPVKPAGPSCEERIRKARAEPALPGAPGFEARRAEIVARAKSEPVLFRRAPELASEVSTEVSSIRAQLDKSPSPAWALHGVYGHLRNRPLVARGVLLREGYLYSESPDLAAAFVDFVELHHLFDDKQLVIQRGTALLHAKKGASFWYEYTDGPERGQRARLLFLDRVWAEGKDPGPALHVALRGVAASAGFEHMRVEHLSEKYLVAKLRYGADWVPALLSTDGPELALECEAIPPEIEARVRAARELTLRRQRILESLRSAMVAMVSESLPFDEPLTEEGQQDGNLRPAWRWAYTHGWDSYTFNDDGYNVFDLKGRPKIPQVCIDFITDTLERASGTWWAGRDGERQRVRGGIDFDDIGIENRRSVDVFIRFAEEHPEWFDVYRLTDDERVRFMERPRFFQHLAENVDRYMPGDVIAIHGPRADGENHWHSFYVYDWDPLSGMPMLLASNAGRPRIRTWEGEMRAAPLRSIHTRIRPRMDWLSQVIRQDQSVTLRGPAPLISAPI